MRSFRRAGRQGRQRNDPEDAPIFRTGEEGGRGGTEGAEAPAAREEENRFPDTQRRKCWEEEGMTECYWEVEKDADWDVNTNMGLGNEVITGETWESGLLEWQRWKLG